MVSKAFNIDTGETKPACEKNKTCSGLKTDEKTGSLKNLEKDSKPSTVRCEEKGNEESKPSTCAGDKTPSKTPTSSNNTP